MMAYSIRTQQLHARRLRRRLSVVLFVTILVVVAEYYGIGTGTITGGRVIGCLGQSHKYYAHQPQKQPGGQFNQQKQKQKYYASQGQGQGRLENSNQNQKENQKYYASQPQKQKQERKQQHNHESDISHR